MTARNRTSASHQDGSLADTVAERLRAAIRDGSLPPGTRLVERRLAAQFGTSHIPIREALTRLVEEGLVERSPRRSARVAQLDARALGELETLRIVLEQFVVQRAQERWSRAAERDLRRIAREMVDAARRSDVAALHSLDESFHERLWRLADHRLLIEVVAGLRSRISRFLLDTTEALPEEELRAHAQTHVDLVDVIASGDAEAAARAIAAHITAAAHRIGAAAGDDEPDDGLNQPGRGAGRARKAPRHRDR